MDEPTPTPESGSDPSTRPPSASVDPGAVEFLTLGLTVAVALVGLAGLGYAVDRWLGTSPWFTLLGVVLGIAAAVLITVARVRRFL